jgi:hypothetical protein
MASVKCVGGEVCQPGLLPGPALGLIYAEAGIDAIKHSRSVDKLLCEAASALVKTLKTEEGFLPPGGWGSFPNADGLSITAEPYTYKLLQNILQTLEEAPQRLKRLMLIDIQCCPGYAASLVDLIWAQLRGSCAADSSSYERRSRIPQPPPPICSGWRLQQLHLGVPMTPAQAEGLLGHLPLIQDLELTLVPPFDMTAPPPLEPQREQPGDSVLLPAHWSTSKVSSSTIRKLALEFRGYWQLDIGSLAGAEQLEQLMIHGSGCSCCSEGGLVVLANPQALQTRTGLRELHVVGCQLAPGFSPGQWEDLAQGLTQLESLDCLLVGSSHSFPLAKVQHLERLHTLRTNTLLLDDNTPPCRIKHLMLWRGFDLRGAPAAPSQLPGSFSRLLPALESLDVVCTSDSTWLPALQQHPVIRSLGVRQVGPDEGVPSAWCAANLSSCAQLEAVKISATDDGEPDVLLRDLAQCSRLHSLWLHHTSERPGARISSAALQALAQGLAGGQLQSLHFSSDPTLQISELAALLPTSAAGAAEVGPAAAGAAGPAADTGAAGAPGQLQQAPQGLGQVSSLSLGVDLGAEAGASIAHMLQQVALEQLALMADPGGLPLSVVTHAFAAAKGQLVAAGVSVAECLSASLEPEEGSLVLFIRRQGGGELELRVRLPPPGHVGE